MARTFTANFDSECGECCLDIYAGDPVGWRDGGVVHESCMEDEEDETSSRTATAAPAASPAATTRAASATRSRTRNKMTDVMPEQAPADQGWDAPERDSEASYPEMPANPHNHIYTVSMDGRGPMVVVRGNTPQEISERYQALLESGATAVAASVYSHLKAEMAVASGVGPVTPVPAPQASPGAPQPVPLPQAPQAQYPQATQPPNQPYAGQPAWQQAGAPQAPQAPSPEYHNAGWHRLDVPFPKKGQFDAIVAQYGMQKGRPSEGGSYSFNSRGEKAWYVSPQYAGAFSMFNPVPA